MILKIKKIGGSNFIIVPHSYLEVFELKDSEYKFSVEEEGKKLIYTRIDAEEIVNKA